MTLNKTAVSSLKMPLVLFYYIDIVRYPEHPIMNAGELLTFQLLLLISGKGCKCTKILAYNQHLFLHIRGNVLPELHD